MTVVITALGILICVVSLVLAVSPRALMKLVEGLQISTKLRMLAAAVRIGIGVLLFLAAPLTNYSLALQVIGVLLIVVGAILLFVNNSMLQTLVDWVVNAESFVVRIGAVFGLGFGGFIIYASL